MTIAHKNLTGTDLHEPKGADTATTNQVYVSDGAGSGDWTDTSTFNPFGGKLLHLQETDTVVSAVTNGSARNLNTVVTNEIAGASLAAKQITLPAGTYFASADVGIVGGLRQVAYLYNVTAGSMLLRGHTQHIPNQVYTSIVIGGSGQVIGTTVIAPSGIVPIRGRFTLAATTTVELRHNVESSGSNGALSASPNIFINLLIWKIS